MCSPGLTARSISFSMLALFICTFTTRALDSATLQKVGLDRKQGARDFYRFRPARIMKWNMRTRIILMSTLSHLRTRRRQRWSKGTSSNKFTIHSVFSSS